MTVRLGDVFEISNERLGDYAEEPPVFAISKYDGVVLGSDYHERRVASDKLNTYKVLRPADWAYSTIHIDEGSIARNNHEFLGVVSPMYTILRWTNEDHDPRYFEHLLRSPEMLATYGDMAQGSINRRRSLPWKSFSSISVQVPSIDEQRRIVDLIGAVNGAINAASNGAANSDALWWRLASELQERVTEAESRPFGAIAAISGGLTKNKKDADRPDSIEVPYLRVANVHRRYLDLTDVSTISATPEKLEALRLQPGDLLLNEGGDKDKLGRGAIWRGELRDCIHQNHVFRARISDANFNPEFVSAWANSYGQGWFETYGTQTTGIASISKTTLGKFPIPCLPLQEQEKWADLLDSAMFTQDNYRATAGSLRTLRSELLSALLSGAHRIPETYDELMGA